MLVHYLMFTNTTFAFNNIHSKQCWVVLTQNRVKYGQTQMLG